MDFYRCVDDNCYGNPLVINSFNRPLDTPVRIGSNKYKKTGKPSYIEQKAKALVTSHIQSQNKL